MNTSTTKATTLYVGSITISTTLKFKSS